MRDTALYNLIESFNNPHYIDKETEVQSDWLGYFQLGAEFICSMADARVEVLNPLLHFFQNSGSVGWTNHRQLEKDI